MYSSILPPDLVSGILGRSIDWRQELRPTLLGALLYLTPYLAHFAECLARPSELTIMLDDRKNI